MTSYSSIQIKEKNGVAVITINRPHKLNALNRVTLTELHDAFCKASNNKKIRVIILTGRGTKAFVAGADISEFADFSVSQATALSAEGHKNIFDYIENLATPVIAAVNGFALGGGLELAMACHFRVASDTAKLGLPEVSLGLIPGYGGTQRLPQLIGKGRAMELIITGGMIDAEQALQYGLVNHVVKQEALLSFCEMIALRIAANSPVAISAVIKSINAYFKPGINGYHVEVQEFGNCFGTDDFREGTTAFLEKRKANFTGA